MIQINLPGSKNIFFIEDISQLRTVEEEFINVFYPYATETKCMSIKSEYDLFIQTDGYRISVKKIKCNSSESLSTKCYMEHEIFKQIYVIIRENLQLQDEFCYLHGASILIDGIPCVFLAETGMGKSTLSVYYDIMNHMCLTDDIIILEKESYKLFPLSKYAHIRPSNPVLLQGVTDLLQYNEIIHRYKFLLSDKRFCNEYYIKFIFVIHRRQSDVRIKLSANPIVEVLENMFLPYQVKNNVLSVSSICRNFKIYDVIYDDLDTLLSKIKLFIRNNIM